MSGHLDDARIQDALDGRLGPGPLADVREHVRGCAACAERWEAYEAFKRSAARLAEVAVPGAVGEGVQAALDAEDGRRGGGWLDRPRWLAAAVAAAAVVAVGLGAWIALRPSTTVVEKETVPGQTAGPGATVPSDAAASALPRRVAQDFRAFRSGAAALAVETADPAALERHLAGQGLGFPVRVFDLAMMRQTLLGGGLGDVAGGRSALFAYRGADGALVVCQMYRGTLAELPPPLERREHDGIPFQVYRDGELTVVFWPEGGVVCVLVGDGPAESVIALALAKAMIAA